MTQTLSAPSTFTVELADQMRTAMLAAAEIPTEGGRPNLVAPGTSAIWGALIKITAEHRPTDPAGPAGTPRWDTYVLPEHLGRVIGRMTHIDRREVYAITALRGALGGTTRI